MSYSYKSFFRQLLTDAPPQRACNARDVDGFMAWKEETRLHLAELLGLSRLEQIAAQAAPFSRKPELLESLQEDGYVRHKMRLQTLPCVFMPFYMLVPDGLPASCPSSAIIAIPAHGASKESVAGVLSSPGVKDKLDRTPKENYGQEFARKGYIVFCPDPPGYGERLEPASMEDIAFLGGSSPNPLGSSCKNLTMTAEALGLTFAGLVLWDMMRLVDYIETLSFIDGSTLGCCGFSGGGLYTLWLAAMDDRIRLAVISGYLHGVGGSVMETHLCPCNFVPGLWKHYDMSDIASLIAPRPAFFETGTRDVLNGPEGIENPVNQFHRLRQVYSLFGKESDVRHGIFDGPHMWYGLGYSFADEYLHV